METQAEIFKELDRLISKEDIADKLNETALNYSILSLGQVDSCSINPDTSSEIYWLIEMRDFFRKWSKITEN